MGSSRGKEMTTNLEIDAVRALQEIARKIGELSETLKSIDVRLASIDGRLKRAEPYLDAVS